MSDFILRNVWVGLWGLQLSWDFRFYGRAVNLMSETKFCCVTLQIVVCLGKVVYSIGFEFYFLSPAAGSFQMSRESKPLFNGRQTVLIRRK